MKRKGQGADTGNAGHFDRHDRAEATTELTHGPFGLGRGDYITFSHANGDFVGEHGVEGIVVELDETGKLTAHSYSYLELTAFAPAGALDDHEEKLSEWFRTEFGVELDNDLGWTDTRANRPLAIDVDTEMHDLVATALADPAQQRLHQMAQPGLPSDKPALGRAMAGQGFDYTQEDLDDFAQELAGIRRVAHRL